jgi:hypothetical protein
MKGLPGRRIRAATKVRRVDCFGIERTAIPQSEVARLLDVTPRYIQKLHQRRIAPHPIFHRYEGGEDHYTLEQVNLLKRYKIAKYRRQTEPYFRRKDHILEEVADKMQRNWENVCNI